MEISAADQKDAAATPSPADNAAPAEGGEKKLSKSALKKLAKGKVCMWMYEWYKYFFSYP